MQLLRQPRFLAVALSHFSVDAFNSQIGLLLAALSLSLGLTNATIGLIATSYALVGALSQPFFGWLTDKYGGRWTVAGGVLWMASFYTLVALTDGYWPIVFLIIAALGSGAFHPAGTALAAQSGQRYLAGQVATASALFFVFGQGGYTLGPALGGAVLEYVGRGGLLWLVMVGLPIGLFAARTLRDIRRPAPVSSQAVVDVDVQDERPSWFLFGLLIVLSGLAAWAQSATSTFSPKFYQEQGLSPTHYGVIVATFTGGMALGGLLGGLLGDRWGRRRTVTLALALSIAPFYFLPLARGVGVFPLAFLAGLFVGAPHSILVTTAQKAMPGKAALASGLILGFMFASASFGSYLSGLAADRVGLGLVLQANALIVGVAVLLSLLMRAEAKAPVKAVATAGD
jgi:FSR family fosmidomycin resistance protein-like MFS transporter